MIHEMLGVISNIYRWEHGNSETKVDSSKFPGIVNGIIGMDFLWIVIVKLSDFSTTLEDCLGQNVII